MIKRWITPLSIIVVIAAGIAGYVYWRSMQQQGAGAQGFPPTVIAATDITQENWQPSLQSVGSLVAINGINVSTEVSGIVSDIVFTSGQPVNKGDVLIRLDDSVDEAALEALRAESKLAEVQFSRAKDLLKQRVTSKSEYDEAQAKYDAARARVKQQEAVIKRKVIRAPFSGLAGIRAVNLGQFIEAGNPIVGLQALDPIYVDYTLPERYLTRVQPGQKVNVKLDAIPDRVFSGEVTAVDSGIDTGTRTLKVRATLANADNLLRPGMFAEVETITGEAQTVMTLPRTAISFNTYGNFVFVINKNEQGMMMVKRTPIETGDVREGRVQVKGLSAGTQVVRTGLVKLRDGMPVNIDNQVQLNDAEIKGE
ncbi:MAG: efflux RND transporter periplasmic adaptor subunit [Gammaproteobacteria bacterium]|nr:MAG: efflux RND transporter periplasmic adaptor subunit [Gammaproteobacteria bacterium]